VLAAGCELVFVCVTGSPQVEAVLAGPGGLLEAPAPGLIVVDCSTSEPESTQRLRALALQRGAELVDAPLARTPVEAEAGRLNVMVGAEPATFARVEPVLRCFAENVFHVGGPGAGHTIKLCAPLLPPAHGRRLTRCLPQARFELIEGWGHDLPAALLPRLAATVQFHSG
jgi:3-hydroxyisobutyrate dehydrogenase-like beta-hydroxyacid dehydrogenase